jgi:hypothetical protein
VKRLSLAKPRGPKEVQSFFGKDGKTDSILFKGLNHLLSIAYNLNLAPMTTTIGFIVCRRSRPIPHGSLPGQKPLKEFSLRFSGFVLKNHLPVLYQRPCRAPGFRTKKLASLKSKLANMIFKLASLPSKLARQLSN